MKNVVFFTGSGISAESGIQTFREAGTGLWENFRIEDVCTDTAMVMNRPVVIDFYNHLRQQLLTKHPNEGHLAIARLQEQAEAGDSFRVHVVTQNVDNLHEKAGSNHIVHLHGELMKLRSSLNESAWVSQQERPDLFEDGWRQRPDDRHADGSLLRPYIVFFGESVPEFVPAIELAEKADIFVVVGTSLAVYPAASLLHYVRKDVPIFCIDPGEPELGYYQDRITHIRKPASTGVPEVCQRIQEML